ncbi:MobA/MobL family protein [Methylomagnum ishizawai]|uniref:MobA/MobL family protein n=1 Tax=Methylomagnum ishizawai TaxID=1760988 RepID=UPI0034CF6DD9
MNASLERAGLDERVDHRSFKERGIEQVPSEHLGVEASGMERAREAEPTRRPQPRECQRNQRINELTEQRTLDGEIEREEASHQGAVGKEAESGSYWRDRINGERETSQEDPPPASPQGIQPEESKAAQSAFADSIALASSAQLNRQGEVKHGGLAPVLGGTCQGASAGAMAGAFRNAQGGRTATPRQEQVTAWRKKKAIKRSWTSFGKAHKKPRKVPLPILATPTKHS